MSGMKTMARLELMLRFRAGRWRWLLLSWFLGLVLFSVLLELVVRRSVGYQGHEGTVLFGGLQLFMLALALFIVPALTSQSVNGDREQGRLGVLQVTELTPTDIIGGKLLAAWGTACVFVIVSAPITIWAMVQGGITVWQVLVVSLVMMLLLGIICAIGLGLSAILSRSTTSSVLTYVAVFVLAVGTVVLSGLVTAINEPSDGGLIWQPLVANPFVILADAAPSAPMTRTCYSIRGGSAIRSTGSAPVPSTSSPKVICQTTLLAGDVLGGIRQGIRNDEHPNSSESGGTPVWPYGLGFDLVIVGAGCGRQCDGFARRGARTQWCPAGVSVGTFGAHSVLWIGLRFPKTTGRTYRIDRQHNGTDSTDPGTPIGTRRKNWTARGDGQTDNRQQTRRRSADGQHRPSMNCFCLRFVSIAHDTTTPSPQ